MSSTQPPKGPGQGNIKNIDGTPLSYFQRSDMELSNNTISTVYAGLLGSYSVHDITLDQFAQNLNECSFFVQGYDNNHCVSFGAIKNLNANDVATLSNYYGGYGVDPYGISGYGGGFAYKGIFGEIRYVWSDPAYAYDHPEWRVVDLLLQSQADFVNPAQSRQALCVIPSPIPPGVVSNYQRYLVSTELANSGVKVTQIGTANTAKTPYNNLIAPTSVILTFSK